MVELAKTTPQTAPASAQIPAATAAGPKNAQAVKAAPSTHHGKRATGETEEQKKARKAGIAARRGHHAK